MRWGSWGRFCFFVVVPFSWMNLLLLKDNQTHHRCSMLFCCKKTTFSNLTWCFSIIFKFWLFKNMFLWWENMRFVFFRYSFGLHPKNNITQPTKKMLKPNQKITVKFLSSFFGLFFAGQTWTGTTGTCWTAGWLPLPCGTTTSKPMGPHDLTNGLPQNL